MPLALVINLRPCVPLDREARSRFKAELGVQRRPGRLTNATAQIGRVMLDMLGADGRLDPSLATIAARARVSVSAVKRGLAQLRACGFVTWTRRLIRDAASGWRTEQASNAYALTVPACGVHSEPAVQPGFARTEARPLTDADARLNAARQLALLGAPIPAGWGIAMK